MVIIARIIAADAVEKSLAEQGSISAATDFPAFALLTSSAAI